MKTLLITLGDSWTYGVGASEPTIFDMYDKNTTDKDEYWLAEDKLIETRSWPYLLSKEKNWDLMNLGKPALSNNGSHMIFLEFINDNREFIESYNSVKVIFMTSNPDRFTLVDKHTNDYLRLIYRNDKAVYDMIHWLRLSVYDNIEYIRKSAFYDDDMVSKSVMYLSGIDAMCKNMGFDFYWATAFTKTSVYERSRYSDSLDFNKLINVDYDSILSILDIKDISTCAHPNENGYKLITEYISKRINDIDASLLIPEGKPNDEKAIDYSRKSESFWS